MSKNIEVRRNPALMQTINGIVSRNLLDIFCDEMVLVAKKLTPIKTGNNMRSIFAKQNSELDFTVATASGYGAVLELGSSRMPARPYMAPGAEAGRVKLAATAEREWQQ